MNEVKGMARAGETMGKAMGTGIRSAREGATRARQAGREFSRHAAARAEHELALHGISAEELQERLAQKASHLTSSQAGEQVEIGKKSAKKAAKAGRKAAKKAGKKAEQNVTVSKREAKKAAKASRKAMKHGRTAGQELTAGMDVAKKSRKWPWVLLVLAALAAVAAVVLSRRPEEYPMAEADDEAFPTHDSDNAQPMSPNGDRPAHSQSSMGSGRNA